MNVKIPSPYLNIIVRWHVKLLTLARWNGCFSTVFLIKSGISQVEICLPCRVFNFFSTISDYCKITQKWFGIFFI